MSDPRNIEDRAEIQDFEERKRAFLADIAVEKAQPKPDRKRIRNLFRQIHVIEGGYAPRADSAIFRQPSADNVEPIDSDSCGLVDDELTPTVKPVTAREHDENLGLTDDEMPTKGEQLYAEQFAIGRALRVVLKCFLSRRDPHIAFKKLMVFCHFIQPDLIGCPETKDLAAELGCSVMEISRLGKLFRKKLGIRSSRMRFTPLAKVQDSDDEDSELDELDADQKDREFVNQLDGEWIGNESNE